MLFFEGVGEAHLYRLVSSLAEKTGFTVFGPGTIRGVDFLLARDVVVLEVEDTVFESYSGTKQLTRFASLAKIYDAFYVLVLPLPEDPLDAKFPVVGFFARTERAGLRKRELWFLYSAGGEVRVARVVLKGSPRLRAEGLGRVIELEELSPGHVHERISGLYSGTDRKGVRRPGGTA